MKNPHGSSRKFTGTKTKAKGMKNSSNSASTAAGNASQDVGSGTSGNTVRRKQESYESPAQLPRIRLLFGIFQAGRFGTLKELAKAIQGNDEKPLSEDTIAPRSRYLPRGVLALTPGGGVKSNLASLFWAARTLR
jgi:hypothetical protein